MRVTFWLPRLPVNAGMNFLGAGGLVAVVLAIGALAGNWWWSVLAGGVLAVAMSAWSQIQAEMSARPVRPVAAAKVRPRAVAEDAAA